MNEDMTSKERIEEKHFDHFAIKYDQTHYMSNFSLFKQQKKIQSVVGIANILDKKKLKILEIGCGTGQYTRHLAQNYRNNKIIAIDISRNMLNIAGEYCEELSNVEFVKGSVYALPFEENSVDAIFGFYILHHLDLGLTCKEVYRVLRPGGVCCFVEPNIVNPLVWLIKSNKYLKNLVGDSPDEWAINPFTISKNFSTFKSIHISTSEFLLPLSIFPLEWQIRIDKIVTKICSIWPVKYFGGSTTIAFKKEE
ncbi:MAG: class I SAM-dependent methyltransferase [bacterium]